MGCLHRLISERAGQSVEYIPYGGEVRPPRVHLWAGVSGCSEVYNLVVMKKLTLYEADSAKLGVKLVTLKCCFKAARSLNNMPKALYIHEVSGNLLVNEMKRIDSQCDKRAQCRTEQNFVELQ